MLLIPCYRQYTAGRPYAAILPALVLLLHAVNLDKVCCWLLLPPSLSISSLCVAGRCSSPVLASGEAGDRELMPTKETKGGFSNGNQRRHKMSLSLTHLQEPAGKCVVGYNADY
jgi:hypothetical protein